MRLDLDFFDDAGVQSLYEDHSPDEADAAVVLFIRMVIRAHRLDRPDVLEEFQRSKSERRKATLAMLADAGLLDERGIKPESFGLWRTPDSGVYTSERGRAGGLARAASAERDDAGRMLASDQRMTSVDQRGEPGAVRFGAVRESVPTNDSTSTNDDPIHPHFENVARLMEDLTGKPYALGDPWSRMSSMILDLVDRFGYQEVESKARLVASRMKARPSVRDVIFNVSSALAQTVSTSDLQKEERQAEISDDHQRRLDRTQLALHHQHTEPSEHPACPACRGEVAV